VGEPEIRVSHWPIAATRLLQILLRPFNPVIAVALVSDSDMEGGASADKTNVASNRISELKVSR